MGLKAVTRIVSFSIEGLAGRVEAVHHTLNDDVNVFWGPNGNGKTSMLRILHSALDNNVESLRSVAFKSAEVKFYSEDHDCTYTRTITKEKVQSAKPMRERVWDEDFEGYVIIENPSGTSSRWTTTPKAKRGSMPFVHGWLPITRITDSGSQSRRGRYPISPGGLTESDIDQIFAEGINDRWREWRYHSTARIGEAQDIALTEVLEVALRGAVSRDASVEPLGTEQAYDVVNSFFGERNQNIRFRFRSFSEFKRRYEKDQLLRDIVQRLQTVESEISRIQEPQKKLEELIVQLFSKNRAVTFRSEGIVVEVHGERIPIGYLSSGERQLMLILLECLRSVTSTIMIDEPELSMHVAWQNRLIASMRRINSAPQLIMATHSPEIMAELEDRCVIEL